MISCACFFIFAKIFLEIYILIVEKIFDIFGDFFAVLVDKQFNDVVKLVSIKIWGGGSTALTTPQL